MVIKVTSEFYHLGYSSDVQHAGARAFPWEGRTPRPRPPSARVRACPVEWNSSSAVSPSENRWLATNVEENGDALCMAAMPRHLSGTNLPGCAEEGEPAFDGAQQALFKPIHGRPAGGASV